MYLFVLGDSVLGDSGVTTAGPRPCAAAVGSDAELVIKRPLAGGTAVFACGDLVAVSKVSAAVMYPVLAGLLGACGIRRACVTTSS